MGRSFVLLSNSRACRSGIRNRKAKSMKLMFRSLTLAAVVGCFLVAQSAFAGACCTKAVADAKAGKVCEHSLTKQCCKDAVTKAGVADQSKSCPQCAAKKK